MCDTVLWVSALLDPLQVTVTLILFVGLMGFHLFTSSHQRSIVTHPPVHTERWPQFFHVFVSQLMRLPLFLYRTVQKVRQAIAWTQRHTLLNHRWMRKHKHWWVLYVTYVHTNTQHTHNPITLHCRTKGRKEGRGAFSIDFSSSQSHSRWPQVCSKRANQRRWWAHTYLISGPWFAAVAWHANRSSLCSSHGSLCHTLGAGRQSGIQPRLVAVDRKKIAVPMLWHLPNIRTIMYYSPTQQCIHLWVCVWVREGMWCGHDMLSSDLWGPTCHPFLSESALRLCFLEYGSFVWIFTGHKCAASFMGSVQLTYTGLVFEGSLGWAVVGFLSELYFGLLICTFLILDRFCWFDKMPEANYLFSVSWGYIKVRLESFNHQIYL